MKLTNEVKKQIKGLRNNKQDQELANYLVSLIAGNNTLGTVNDLYEYVLITKVHNKNEFWINNNIINYVGDILSGKKMYEGYSVKFYELAKTRKSVLGAAKYYSCRILSKDQVNPEKLAKTVFKSFETAISLKNYMNQDAFEFCTHDENSLEMCHTQFLDAFLKAMSLKAELSEADFAIQLILITTLIVMFLKEIVSVSSADLQITAKKLYQSSLALTDDNYPIYSLVIRLRATLLKWQVNIILLEEPNALPAAGRPFELPTGELLSMNFESAWSVVGNNDGRLSVCNATVLTNLYNTDKTKAENELKLVRKKMVENGIESDKLEESDDVSNKIKVKELKELKEEYGELFEKKEELDKLLREMEAHFQDYTPLGRATYRRYATEFAFFNPRRNKKKDELRQLTHAIIDQRFRSKSSEHDVVVLTNYSTRLTITAERLFQEAVGILADKYLPELGIPVARIELLSPPYVGVKKYGPHELYEIGGTIAEFEHRANPKLHRRGDSKLIGGGKYTGDIYPLLMQFTNNDIEIQKEVALLMLRYGRSHQVATLDELNAIKNGIKVMSEELSEEAIEEAINAKKNPPNQAPSQTSNNAEQEWQKISEAQRHEFNRICFLVMEKEQMQWHSATEKKYQAGMIVAQTRCLKMLVFGYLEFKEVFKNNVLFGIYSKKYLYDNFEEVKNTCDRVEKRYSDFLIFQNFKFYMAFRKKFIDADSVPVSTRSKMHDDLIEVHGGQSDTDNEETYDSEIDMAP